MKHISMRVLASLAVLLALGGCADTTPYTDPKYSAAPPPADADVNYRLLLIGDAGDDDEGDSPSLRLLEADVARSPVRTSVVFLGDLIYERGYPAHGSPSQRERAQRRLASQLRAVGDAQGVLIPGNHDWDSGKDGGWDNVRALSDAVDAYALETKQRLQVVPGRGCPGPIAMPLGTKLSLIALDSQWWLHQHARPTEKDNPDGCAETSEADVLSALRERLVEARRDGRQAVIATHQPLRSYGPHGGFYDWRSQIFPVTMLVPWAWIPLPGLGSIVTYWRSHNSWMHQDFSNPSYQHMRERFDDALRQAAEQGIAPVAYAGGHEHTFQVIRDPSTRIHHLISGLGSGRQVMHATHGDDTMLSYSAAGVMGWMELRVRNDGAVHLSVKEVNENEDGGKMVFATWLVDGR